MVQVDITFCEAHVVATGAIHLLSTSPDVYKPGLWGPMPVPTSHASRHQVSAQQMYGLSHHDVKFMNMFVYLCYWSRVLNS